MFGSPGASVQILNSPLDHSGRRYELVEMITIMTEGVVACLT